MIYIRRGISGKVIAFLLVTLISNVSYAFINVNVNINFVEPPPCEINNGQPVEVNFGPMNIGDINGGKYRQEIRLNLNCDIWATSLKIKFVGDSAEFDSEVLKTNQEGLGIEIQREIRGGIARLPVNEWFRYSKFDYLKVHAAPVVLDEKGIDAGVVSSVSTVLIEVD